jgi:hypothetical protein
MEEKKQQAASGSYKKVDIIVYLQEDLLLRLAIYRWSYDPRFVARIGIVTASGLRPAESSIKHSKTPLQSGRYQVALHR